MRARNQLTAGSRWKMTTLPPLSPVARRSPSWLNSTQEMMSASVTSSSRVPLTWLKHHWTSEEPEPEPLPLAPDDGPLPSPSAGDVGQICEDVGGSPFRQ